MIARLGAASASLFFRASCSPLCARARAVEFGSDRRFDLTTFSSRSRRREQVVARSGRRRSTTALDGGARKIGVATRPGARTPLSGQSRGVANSGVR
jgi:hypothetical protein